MDLNHYMIHKWEAKEPLQRPTKLTRLPREKSCTVRCCRDRRGRRRERPLLAKTVP